LELPLSVDAEAASESRHPILDPPAFDPQGKGRPNLPPFAYLEIFAAVGKFNSQNEECYH
jgi:hypothetical protein